MPKDEFDFEDPLELNGMAFATEEETTGVMAECFAEEFMRLGYNAKQVLALFQNRDYLGLNLALQNHGEAFIRAVIADVFARWGRAVPWTSGDSSVEPDSPALDSASTNQSQSVNEPGVYEFETAATDPMGAPVPRLNS